MAKRNEKKKETWFRTILPQYFRLCRHFNLFQMSASLPSPVFNRIQHMYFCFVSSHLTIHSHSHSHYSACDIIDSPMTFNFAYIAKRRKREKVVSAFDWKKLYIIEQKKKRHNPLSAQTTHMFRLIPSNDNYFAVSERHAWCDKSDKQLPLSFSRITHHWSAGSFPSNQSIRSDSAALHNFNAFKICW